MNEIHIHHVPVMAYNHLAGIISLWDADKDIIEELEFQVEQLIMLVTGFRKALTKDLRKL